MGAGYRKGTSSALRPDTRQIWRGKSWRGADIDRYGWMKSRNAKFGIGQVVRHRKYAFRGIVYDVDPEFANTEEWWEAIPEDVRPHKDQPFYHLYAENADTEYVAYVSEQNLLADETGDPVRHPQVDEMFVRATDGFYQVKADRLN